MWVNFDKKVSLRKDIVSRSLKYQGEYNSMNCFGFYEWINFPDVNPSFDKLNIEN
jgi:hypothetical protein